MAIEVLMPKLGLTMEEGTIEEWKMKVGDTVKKGQVLMVLEAMKMENEIMAPRDGKVTAVAVAKGAAVESGALLCTIQ